MNPQPQTESPQSSTTPDRTKKTKELIYCTRWLKEFQGTDLECPPQSIKPDRQYVNIDLMGYPGRWVCATCFKPARSFYRACIKVCDNCGRNYSRLAEQFPCCKACSKELGIPFTGWKDVTRFILNDPTTHLIRDQRTWKNDWREEFAFLRLDYRKSPVV